jgi:hypothetical protein
MVAHETQDLYWFKPLCSVNPSLVKGATLLVLVWSVIGAVAPSPSYVVDGMKGNEIDPDREVPTLLYIG